jgi:hypothetical protein
MHSVRYFNISCDPLNVSLRAPVEVRCDEPCGSGMYFSAIETQCGLTQCRITIDHHEYDFSQLQNYRYSLATPTYEQPTFYFSLCQYANQPVDAEHPNAVQPGDTSFISAADSWRNMEE